MKNKELEDYYDNYLSLFLHPGWKQLIEQWSDAAVLLNDITTIKDGRDLDVRQGQLHATTTLLNFETSVRQTIAAIEDSEEDSDDL